MIIKPMAKCIILLAEDEFITALDIKNMILKETDAEVITTAHGEKILPLADERRPDLIISDIRLKGDINGIEAVKNVRKTHDMPVIFISAYVVNGFLSQVDKIPNAFIIPKPLNVGVLLSLIKSVIPVNQPA